MVRYWLYFLALTLLGGCYTFNGISIDPSVKTFTVINFENAAGNAPPTLAIDFTEILKDKVRTETRLLLNTDNPDVEFSGKITDFRVVPVAPRPGETVTLNRLEIKIQVAYFNNLDETKGWANDRTFSHFAEFDNNVDLLSVQEQLITQINAQLLEDIFNAAFNNW